MTRPRPAMAAESNACGHGNAVGQTSIVYRRHDSVLFSVLRAVGVVKERERERELWGRRWTMGQWCGCVMPDGSFNNRVDSSTDQGPTSGSSATRHNDSTDGAVEIKAGLCNADPITKHGKRIQMAQMLCIPLIPIIILIIQACLSLADSVASKVLYLLSLSCSAFH